VKKIAVLIVLALVLFVASQAAYAAANFLPAVKVGNGWVSVVSYVNTQAPNLINPQVFIHATWQVKDPTDLTAACTHLDGPSLTTRNDLTTTKLNSTGGGVGDVFPAGDTMGSAIIEPPTLAGGIASEGFLVLENYDGVNTLGADGTLTSEAIVFNLGSGFLYSNRALTVSHIAASPGGNVSIEAPGCNECNYLPATPFSNGAARTFNNTTSGTLSRFIFLPPATATTGAYVIAVNRPGTAEAAQPISSFNLVAPNYDAAIRLEARMDVAQGYAQGVYNRLEDFRSVVKSNDLVCLASLTADQLVDAGTATFITDGGWMNLSPRCLEGGVCNGDALGVETGDAAIIYKTEFKAGYGFAATPQHQQWFVK
jgi:hypothetical protein